MWCCVSALAMKALSGCPPASVYRPSLRLFPDRLPPIEYPGHFQGRFVCNAGTFRFSGLANAKVDLLLRKLRGDPLHRAAQEDQPTGGLRARMRPSSAQ